jgi:hypothetical protein
VKALAALLLLSGAALADASVPAPAPAPELRILDDVCRWLRAGATSTEIATRLHADAAGRLAHPLFSEVRSAEIWSTHGRRPRHFDGVELKVARFGDLRVGQLASRFAGRFDRFEGSWITPDPVTWWRARSRDGCRLEAEIYDDENDTARLTELKLAR